jgi:predicted ATP-grasp superfamily ATP-dependent carboligase
MNAAVIPTEYGASAYVCVRSLNKRDIYTIVASEQARVPAAASRYCDEAVRLPSHKDDLLDYRDALLALAERSDVATIIPIRPEDGYLLSKYHSLFAPHVSLPVPSFDALRTVHDRLELARAAEEAGVPVPDTCRLSTVEDWDTERIVKSRYNLVASEYVDHYGPRESTIVKDIEHLQPGDRLATDAAREQYRHEPIAQEFIPTSGEYMFAGLYDSGEAVSTFQHKQIRGDSYTGGGGVYRKSTDIPALDAVANDLLEHLDWHGLACIEYMRDERTGEFVLTEINPRMWQSLPSTVRAGADFPYAYWLQAMGRVDEIDSSYDIGVGSHLIHGEIGYLMSVLKEDSPLVAKPSLVAAICEIVASCVSEPYFDYLSLDDPGPFFRGILNKMSDS